MKPRILTALAIAAGALVVAAAVPSTPSAALSSAAHVPAQEASALDQVLAALLPSAAAATPAPANSDKLVVQGFAAPVPAAWIRSQPSSTMRIAQFALPAAAGAGAGEVAVFFFPRGQGGSQQANIDRWASQFAGADGKPVAPKVTTGKSGNTEVTLVELQGSYARGVGMGPEGSAKPNQTLLIAMVETAGGRITVQMYGPNKTVAAQRANFLKLAKGFRSA